MTQDISPTADRTILNSRQMRAPQVHVRKACSEAEYIDKWWGPNRSINRTIRMDFPVGGEREYTKAGPDGKVWPNLFIYKESEPTKRMAYDHKERGAPKQFEVELRFEELEGGTLVTIRTLFPSNQVCDHVVENSGAVEGERQTLAYWDGYTSQPSH